MACRSVDRVDLEHPNAPWIFLMQAQYLHAVKCGYLTDYEPLVDFFAEAIARTRASEEART